MERPVHLQLNGLTFVLPALLSLALGACASPPSVPASTEPTTSTRDAAPATSHLNLFVENLNDITEYAPDGRLVRMITRGMPKKGINTGALAFDQSRNLYAVNGLFSIAVYAASTRRFLRTITFDVGWPIALICDRQGNLYVGNEENDTVTVYAPGAVRPYRVLSQDINDPEAFAFDSEGNLYVANGNGWSVAVFSPSGELLRNITDGVIGPGALALDSKDDLFVADTNAGYGDTATVYAPHSGRLIDTIRERRGAPASLAVDSTNQLWVSMYGTNHVSLYGADHWKLLRKLQVNGPGTVLLDSSDDLYVACCALRRSAVEVFPPGSKVPSRTITDGVTSMRAMAFGPP
jgi:hypothetical protein